MDDCSTDNSRDIINTYKKHPKVSHIVYNDTNSGSTFKQWQKGIALAKGEYIWIAESDDWAEDSFLEKVNMSLSLYKSSLCFTQSVMINETNSIIGVKDLLMEEFHLNSKKFVLDFLLFGNALYNASMIVFKKELTSNIQWDKLSQYKYCGDWFFWSYVLVSTDNIISQVKEPLNKFRIHSNNVSNKSERNGLTFLEGFKISQDLYDRYLQNSYSHGIFCHKWANKWISYKDKHQFSTKINFRIFKMFLFKEPKVLYYTIKRNS